MKPLLHQKWPSLALDLAVMSFPGSPVDSLDVIYQSYHIDETTLKTILRAPEFQSMYRNALNDLKAQGTRAGQIYRANTLAQALAEKMYEDAMNGTMEAKEAVKLLELLMRSAGTLDGSTAGPTVNVQNNVGIALPIPKGINKLKHLDAT